MPPIDFDIQQSPGPTTTPSTLTGVKKYVEGKAEAGAFTHSGERAEYIMGFDCVQSLSDFLMAEALIDAVPATDLTPTDLDATEDPLDLAVRVAGAYLDRVGLDHCFRRLVADTPSYTVEKPTSTPRLGTDDAVPGELEFEQVTIEGQRFGASALVPETSPNYRPFTELCAELACLLYQEIAEDIDVWSDQNVLDAHATLEKHHHHPDTVVVSEADDQSSLPYVLESRCDVHTSNYLPPDQVVLADSDMAGYQVLFDELEASVWNEPGHVNPIRCPIPSRNLRLDLATNTALLEPDAITGGTLDCR